MKVKHIDHIGIAVKGIAQAGKFYTDILGLKIQDIENVADQKVNVAFLPITDSEVELLESTEPDGPVTPPEDPDGPTTPPEDPDGPIAPPEDPDGVAAGMAADR